MDNKVLDNEKVIGIVRDIFKKHTFIEENGEGFFEYDIYVDYHDEISDRDVKKISQADDKNEAFYETLDEYSLDSMDYEFRNTMEVIEKYWDDEFGDFDEYRDYIIDWVEQHVSFNFPYDHFLKQNVYVNVIVNTGDGNHDYTLNNFLSYNAREDEEIDEESSILWLVKQQGYSKEQLINTETNGDYLNSQFLKSVVQELHNVTTHMNALAFFVKMSLKDFIEFSNNENPLTLKSNSACGLYDCWSGAGSVLQIALENDVVVPVEYIEAHIDGTRGYGIDEIYGMSGGFWKETVIGF